jgi:DNA-binding winged helix-turn-helix (wHTH) protein
MVAADGASLSFPPYRLDLRDMRLFRGGDPLSLRPKTFAVLRLLIERRGQLVAKRELLDAVWPDVVVGDDVLKGCIRELRDALGDDPSTPRYIETAHRLGYRFVFPETPPEVADPVLRPSLAPPMGVRVGQASELAELRAAGARAAAGARELVFVVGQAGAGKTTLVQRFLDELPAGQRVLCGACVDQFGEGEAYLPVLEAFASLARREPSVTELFDVTAPAWRRAGRDGPGHGTATTLVRELASAIDALAAEGGLVFVVEDLHWSDRPTLALLSLLVQRPAPARLLVVGTLRPDALTQAQAPLVQLTSELARKRRAVRIDLRALDLGEVADYATRRLGARGAAPQLAEYLLHRTGGSPMLLGFVADDLITRGKLVLDGDLAVLDAAAASDDVLPPELDQLLAAEVAQRQEDEQRVLEVLAAALVPLGARGIARVLGVDALACEVTCERLAAHPRLVRKDVRPERATLYAPAHALLQATVYGRLGSERAARIHGALVEVLGSGTEGTRDELVHALAHHAERAGEPLTAARFLLRAAELAAERYAPREALALADRAFSLLARGGAVDRELELRLWLARGNAQIALLGYGAEELARSFERARALAGELDDDRRRAEVLLGLRAYYSMRDLSEAARLGAEVLAIAERTEDPGLLLQGHAAAGVSAFCAGALDRAERHYRNVEQGALALVERGLPRAALGLGINGARLSLVSYYRGHPRRAVRELEAALADESVQVDAFQRTSVLIYGAFLHLMRREPQVAHDYAEEAERTSLRDGYKLWEAAARITRGSSLAELGRLDEGIAAMEQGLSVWRAIGAKVLLPSFVAELGLALAKRGALGEARAQLAEALDFSATSGESVLRSELLRLDAEWRALENPSDPACPSLIDQALHVAREQGAHMFELRALTTGLLQAQTRRARTRATKLEKELVRVLACVESEPGLPDLEDARALVG